jgi:hypothetical protein
MRPNFFHITSTFCTFARSSRDLLKLPSPRKQNFFDSRKMCLSPTDHTNRPCLVPPHPKVLARIAEGRLTDPRERVSGQTALSGPTGTLHGLNDGTIFPKSHYQRVPVPSLSRISRAALERAPLRGVIRYAKDSDLVIRNDSE